MFKAIPRRASMLLGLALLALVQACGATNSAVPLPAPATDIPAASASGLQTAVFAGGCFWGVEAVFRHVKGVGSAVSGYVGGTAKTADYEMVSSGSTGHAESVKVTYDPAQVSYGQLLTVFFSVAHDPTQLNRQGNDMGRQYRSAIFYASPTEEQVARGYIQQLQDANVFHRPIVTTLEPLDQFFEAEAYHQGFVARNPNQPYVAAVAVPKVKKLEKSFAEKLKKS